MTNWLKTWWEHRLLWTRIRGRQFWRRCTEHEHAPCSESLSSG